MKGHVMNKWMLAAAVLGMSAVVQAGVVTNVSNNAGYVVGKSTNNLGDKAYIGIRGEGVLASTQCSVVGFSLADVAGEISEARLCLKTMDTKHQPWGSDALPIQVMVLSAGNKLFQAGNGAQGATWETLDGVSRWQDSRGPVGEALQACDGPVVASATVYGSVWKENTWYEIPLAPQTTAALEALRAAGEKTAVLLIRAQPGSPGSREHQGLRFFADTVSGGNSAPRLVLTDNPSPAAAATAAAANGSHSRLILFSGLGGLIVLVALRIRRS